MHFRDAIDRGDSTDLAFGGGGGGGACLCDCVLLFIGQVTSGSHLQMQTHVSATHDANVSLPVDLETMERGRSVD